MSRLSDHIRDTTPPQRNDGAALIVLLCALGAVLTLLVWAFFGAT